MLAMAVMNELEQDLIRRLFSIDFVQGKGKKLIGTCIDHYVEDEYSEERHFHFNYFYVNSSHSPGHLLCTCHGFKLYLKCIDRRIEETQTEKG